MFCAKQKQVIDVNKIIEQTREGEEAKIKLAAVNGVLNSFLEEKSLLFRDRIMKDGGKIYDWEYPFKTFNDELHDIAKAINYVMPDDIQRVYCEDRQTAFDWNAMIKSEKED